MLDRIKNWYHGIPEKKRWIDMVTALLTIPVLLTVIITNLGNLKKNDNKDAKETPQPTIERIIIRDSDGPAASPTQSPVKENQNIANNSTPAPLCKAEPIPYEIAFPREGDKISIDPVCVSLRQIQNDNYCSSVWAYRINESSWSTYSDDPICLYNMASGPIKLEISVKSTVSGDEKISVRNFIYQNGSIPIPTPTLSPVPSVTSPPSGN